MGNKILEDLKIILDGNKQRLIAVIGTTCTGKTTLMKDIPEAVAVSKIAPPLTDEEKAFVYKIPWTREIGEKMMELRGDRTYIEAGKPAFGTVIPKNTELIVYLSIGDETLRKRTTLRNIDFKDAKAMQEWIEEKIKESNLPVINLEILDQF